jgi:hypothetical protein
LSGFISERKPGKAGAIGTGAKAEAEPVDTLTGEHLMLTEEIERAFRQAAGQWAGCDWPTEFGTAGLNLNGLTAAKALMLARATSGRERADWQAALEWLTRLEQDARAAEDLARQALELARGGELEEALVHAERACAIEAIYHSRLVWRTLRDAIEAAHRAGPG